MFFLYVYVTLCAVSRRLRLAGFHLLPGDCRGKAEARAEEDTHRRSDPDKGLGQGKEG